MLTVSGVDVVLGDVILRGLYVVLHRSLQQIGFAPQVTSPRECGAMPPFQSIRTVCGVSDGVSARDLDNNILFDIGFVFIITGTLVCIIGTALGLIISVNDGARKFSRKDDNRARSRALTRFSSVEMHSSSDTDSRNSTGSIVPSFEPRTSRRIRGTARPSSTAVRSREPSTTFEVIQQQQL